MSEPTDIGGSVGPYDPYIHAGQLEQELTAANAKIAELEKENSDLFDNQKKVDQRSSSTAWANLEFKKKIADLENEQDDLKARVAELEARLGPDRRYDLHDCIIERDNLKEKLMKAIDALKFYADCNSWGHISPKIAEYFVIDEIDLGTGEFQFSSENDDSRVGGKRARQVLAEIEGDK